MHTLPDPNPCPDRLACQLRIGDLVFIRVRAALFMQIADATGSWTNHVGVVVDDAGTVAESRFPLSGTTSLARFVGRSEHGRVAIARLRRRLTPSEERAIARAARRRSGVLYDTGFNLSAGRRCCSR
jgi:hypothetical protein